MQERKPQARSLETRRRLMDATLDTIVEVGLPRASTPKINERAGVSNGAQQHHYPTRSELIVSALDESTTNYTSQIENLIEQVPQGSLSLTEFLRIIASTADVHQRYRLCWLEAIVAARTDPELGDAMRPLDQAKTDLFRDIAARLSPDDAELAADLAELTTYLVRGMAVQRGVHDATDFDRLFDLWCKTVETVTNS